MRNKLIATLTIFILSTGNLFSQPNLQWASNYSINGGNDIDPIYVVRQTADGGFISAGMTQSTSGFFTANHGGEDMYV